MSPAIDQRVPPVLLPAAATTGSDLAPLPAPVRVAILDDQQGRYELMLRQGAKALGLTLEILPVWTVPEAVAKLPRFRPRLVFVDLGGVWPALSRDWSEPVGGTLGLAVLRAICPAARMVVVSRLCEPRVVGPIVRLGARGYFQLDEVKNGPPEGFVGALLRVLAGELILSPKATIANEGWMNGAHPDHRSTPQPVLVSLRPGYELCESDASRLARALLRRMDTQLRTVLAGAAAQCDFLWKPQLRGDTKFEMFATMMSSDSIYGVVADAGPPLRESLTRREGEVVVRLAEGRQRRAIADELNISEKSVETYLNRAMDRAEPELLDEIVGPTGRRNVKHFADVVSGRSGLRKVGRVQVVQLPLPRLDPDELPPAAEQQRAA